MLEAQGKSEAAVAEAEVPEATLERAGRPPDFLTVADRGTIATEEDLETVVATCIPTVRRLIGRAPRPLVQSKGRLDIRRIRIAPTLDPGGEKRDKAYHEAVRKKGVAAPRRVRRPEYERDGCVFRAMSGAWGRAPVATFYCQEVTRTDHEVRVIPPGDPEGVVFDALAGNTAYECKCGYASYVRNHGSAAWWARWQREKTDEQMLRHQRVARQCGLKYRYMVSDRELAALLRGRWGFGVTVLHEPSDLCPWRFDAAGHGRGGRHPAQGHHSSICAVSRVGATPSSSRRTRVQVA
ncbi:hypothetical protein [Streptomyces sp. JHA26]|uniref:hypothetical protein n=1 Tax=Streptomyces sp. JHA26 TaxID=1917143 RepID=UPI0011800E2D|nr:hypothetical protein [Streptomyces sp. JHA26]